MIYSVANDFVKINETSGTIQNTSSIFSVEISDKAEIDSGLILPPLNKISFSDKTLYARCIDENMRAELRVVPFVVDMGVGSSSGGSSIGSDSFDQSDLDDIFKE